MMQRDKIYEFMKKYIEENDANDNNEIEYFLRCARQFWFQNLKNSYSIKAKSHIEALVYFYEQFKNDNVTMNNKDFDLIDYALYFVKDEYKSADVFELVRFIIAFYFGYGGIYDCALYIVNNRTENIVYAHEWHDMPIL